LDIYQTEDEQVEALKKWWKENGKSAIFGVVLGILAIFGWREWKDYQFERAAAASQLYQQMIISSRENNSDLLAKKAKEITLDYEGTAYAVFARLALAKIAVTKADLPEAVSHLQWALDNNSQNNLAHVITLRLARVLIAQEKLSEAKTLLGGKVERGEFVVDYLELEADILRLEGNTDAARDTYQKALDIARVSSQDATLIELKLDDLGRREIQ
jgi:predicted negative regulator of RcsB-dependent stress response